MAISKQPCFGLHIFGDICIERFMPSCYYASLVVEELDSLKRPARERVAFKIFWIHIPVFGHIRAKGSETPFGYTPVELFPCFDVINGERMIRFFGQYRCDIEDHQRKDHVLDW